MLGVKKYPQKYINGCRSRFGEKVSAYQSMVAAAKSQAIPDDPGLNTATDTFEHHFFNTLVLALDSHFVHRMRGMELKDCNLLNEVRMLYNSMINNNLLKADNTIKYDPAKSVLKYQIGDEIQFCEADFIRLLS